MQQHHDHATRLDEALPILGYSVTEGTADGVFKIAPPDCVAAKRGGLYPT